MKLALTLGLFLVLTFAATAAPPPPPGPAPQPSPAMSGKANPANNLDQLTKRGFTAEEIEAVKADLKAQEKEAKVLEADIQVLRAEQKREMLKDSLDRAALEKILRALAEKDVARELLMIDLLIKWQTAYGAEKALAIRQVLDGKGGPAGKPGAPKPAGKP